MKRGITARRLRRYYALLAAPMTRFDCGRLCAPRNGGVPYCCDGRRCAPVLFREEYRWHRRRRHGFWRKMPVRTRQDRTLVRGLRHDNLFGSCPGADACRRGLRALSCRFFPFEPFVGAGGRVVGLVYQEERKRDCPLLGKPAGVVNRAYIRNAMRVWQEILDILPAERKLYIRESGKRKHRAARKGERLNLVRPGAARELALRTSGHRSLSPRRSVNTHRKPRGW